MVWKIITCEASDEMPLGITTVAVHAASTSTAKKDTPNFVETHLP